MNNDVQSKAAPVVMASPIALVLVIAVALTSAAMMLLPAVADAFELSKWVLSSHWGSKVDKTTGGKICTIVSKDECQLGQRSSEAGGFSFTFSIAVAPDGNVYVADDNNHRVQELTSEGEFVLMFGWKVNKNGGNLCTKAEESECQAGEEGTGLPEQLGEGQDVAVDQTGHVYVLDVHYHRVVEYSENGEFILLVGGEVNQTKAQVVKAKGSTPTQAEMEEENICTEQEIKTAGVKCQAGVQSAPSSTVPDAFKPRQFAGSLLAIDPEDNVLYVGDNDRVQELQASGKWVGELATSVPINAIAADRSGDLFVVEAQAGANHDVAGVHEYKAGVLQSCVIDSASTTIVGLGVDAYGRLGVIEGEPFEGEPSRGALYRTAGGQCGVKVAGSEFGPLPGNVTPANVAFDIARPSEPLTDRMYIPEKGAAGAPQEIEKYAPVVFPEAKACSAEEVMATSAVLCGEIDPNGLLTAGFFEYGVKEGELMSQTPVVFEGEGEALSSIHESLTGLTPNQEYWYAAVGEAEVSGKREQASSPEASFHTSTPAPEVQGAPSSPFVRSGAAVLYARLNPEHALTHYSFQYAPCGSIAECPSSESTAVQEASTYGLMGVTEEAVGLQPSTTYSYRLVADNHFEYNNHREGGQATGEEGHFTTASVNPQAFTGTYSNVTTTGAVIDGEVNPGGQPAIYTFELGIYNPAGTQFGIVLSAPAGEGVAFTSEQLQLAGLQPGTTYAYRIAISSSYVDNPTHIVYGQPALFTTEGWPVVLAVPSRLGMLAMPASVAFPTVPGGGATPKTVTHTAGQKLANALKTCRKKRGKRRARCEREAHKRYVPKPGSKK